MVAHANLLYEEHWKFTMGVHSFNICFSSMSLLSNLSSLVVFEIERRATSKCIFYAHANDYVYIRMGDRFLAFP